ncbi:MAG: hypothetical protein LBT32_07810 [Peptococcaceae bacterium]|jgi:hypothetical protein|nr:hypothetical protein [Peptococcaceae bacterium]
MTRFSQITRSAIIGLMLSTLLLSGCLTVAPTGGQADPPSEQPQYTELETAIIRYLQRTHPEEIGQIDRFTVTLREDIENSTLVQCIIQSKQQKYLGFFTLEEKEVLTGTLDPAFVDQSIAFGNSVTHSAIPRANDRNSLIPYSYIGGGVNDERIKTMILLYPDDSVIELPLPDGAESYGYVSFDHDASPTAIFARDSQGNTLYTYPPFPPAQEEQYAAAPGGQTNLPEEQPRYSELETIIISYLQRNYPKEISRIDPLTITITLNEVKENSHANLVQCIIQSNQKEYIDFFKIVDNEVWQDDDLRPRNQHSAFDQVTARGNIPLENDSHTAFPYTYMGGFVNDSRIKSLELVYPDDSIVELTLPDGAESYGYVSFDHDGSPTAIFAKDSQGNTL